MAEDSNVINQFLNLLKYEMVKILDNYNPDIHKGLQPIRVLEQNIIHILETQYPNFEELKTLATQFGLKTGIIYVINKEPIIYKDSDGSLIQQTPFISYNKEITIHETFLSYLWTISYALFVTYMEFIENSNIAASVLNSKYVLQANNLVDYGHSIIKTFSKWDLNLPNPERFNIEDDKLKQYIEKNNGIYLYAVLFILFHEISHLKLGHIDLGEQFIRKYYTSPPNEKIKEMEYQADREAFNLMLKNINENRMSKELGCVIAMSAILMLGQNLKSDTHPYKHERLYNALLKLNLKDYDSLWNIASMSIIMWGVKFKVSVNYEFEYKSAKELFLNLYKQLDSI